jgi:hypothetical protein
MQRAEQNIEDMLDDLRRTYHRTRQAAIDEELFEVVSGYDAMSRGVEIQVTAAAKRPASVPERGPRMVLRPND